jgi:hypothetical protein
MLRVAGDERHDRITAIQDIAMGRRLLADLPQWREAAGGGFERAVIKGIDFDKIYPRRFATARL